MPCEADPLTGTLIYIKSVTTIFGVHQLYNHSRHAMQIGVAVANEKNIQIINPDPIFGDIPRTALPPREYTLPLGLTGGYS